MVYVLAGNYQQYRDCVQTLELVASEARYLATPEQAMGLVRPHVICWGTFERRDDFHEMRDCLHRCRASYQVVRERRPARMV